MVVLHHRQERKGTNAGGGIAATRATARPSQWRPAHHVQKRTTGIYVVCGIPDHLNIFLLMKFCTEGRYVVLYYCLNDSLLAYSTTIPPVLSANAQLARCLCQNPLYVHKAHDHAVLLELGSLEHVRVKLQHLFVHARYTVDSILIVPWVFIGKM